MARGKRGGTAHRGGGAAALVGDGTMVVSAASPASVVRAGVEGGLAAGARIALDAAGDPETSRGVLGDVDVLRGDAEEVAALVSFAIDGFDDAVEAARRLLSRGPRLVVVQAGEHGDAFVGSAGEELRLPHLDIEVVDPTGSGDALVATVAALLGSGHRLANAARLAVAAAAHTTSHLGGRPTFTGLADLRRFSAEHPPRDR